LLRETFNCDNIVHEANLGHCKLNNPVEVGSKHTI